MKYTEELYDGIDLIIHLIDTFKKEPEFSAEIRRRESNEVPIKLNDNDLLKIFSELISYSQNANSERVEKVINEESLSVVFNGYDIDFVATLNPCDLVDKYWSSISGIRQQAKLFHIVSLARIIKRSKGFSTIISDIEIPNRILSVSDIESFWTGFDKLLKLFTKMKIPFFQSTTSLLHFLMEIGYDCVKPDSAVMSVSKNLRMYDSDKKERNLRMVVRTIQEYSLSRNIRPPLVDLYFLIKAGQQGAKKYVDEVYYSEY